MLYASSGLMPVVLDVLCFLDRLLCGCSTVAWSTVFLVDGSENGIPPRFRDDRFSGPSSESSDTLVESGSRRLCGPAPGVFRPANAGCAHFCNRYDTLLNPLKPQRVPRFHPRHHGAPIGLTTEKSCRKILLTTYSLVSRAATLSEVVNLGS